MKKLFVIAALVSLSFCVANAQTSPSTNVSASPSNLTTVGTPVKHHGPATVKPVSNVQSNLTTTTSPLKKQGSTSAKTGRTKMAGNVGAPTYRASKATVNNKMQTNTVPIQK